MTTTEQPKSPAVLLLGRSPMTATEIARDLGEIPEDFLGPIQWQRLPEGPDDLIGLFTSSHKCIVDIDSLDVNALKNLASVTKSPEIFSFWVWSRERGDLKIQINRCKSETLTLAPVAV